MPASYPNFYENLPEAEKRLNQTVILYDGEPHYVLCIANYTDDIMRVYMSPYHEKGHAHQRVPHIPYSWHDEPGMTRAQKMDNWMASNPDVLIRKMMNSPAFNRFRPFPLGMCNENGECYYLERNPVRHTQQGLTQEMVSSNVIEVIPSGNRGRRNAVNILSMAMYDTIKGDYPSIEDCLKNLHDPAVQNNAVGFHRDFAILRGPLEMMFLAYKTDVVGVLPHGDVSLVKLGKNYRHTKEAVAELSVFTDIR